MTESPGSPSESPKPLQQFKITVAQGVIGAVSLAGTTAIPLLVQRYLTPPTPTESPAAQVSPAPVASPTNAAIPAAGQPVVNAAPSPATAITPAFVQPDPNAVNSATIQVIEGEESKQGGKRGKRSRKEED